MIFCIATYSQSHGAVRIEPVIFSRAALVGNQGPTKWLISSESPLGLNPLIGVNCISDMHICFYVSWLCLYFMVITA